MLYPVELWVQAAATAVFFAKSGCAATGVLGVRGCIGLANSENDAAALGGGFGPALGLKISVGIGLFGSSKRGV